MQQTKPPVTAPACAGAAPDVFAAEAQVLGKFKELVGAMANVVKQIGLLAVLAIFVLLPGCSDDSVPSRPNPPGHNESTEWARLTFEQAKALSVAEEKLLLVYIAASWCPYTAKMDEETWVDPSVIAWVHHTAIAIRWDLGGDTWMPVQIGAVPATAVYAGESEIARHEGYLAAPEFLEWLRSIETTRGRQVGQTATEQSLAPAARCCQVD